MPNKKIYHTCNKTNHRRAANHDHHKVISTISKFDRFKREPQIKIYTSNLHTSIMIVLHKLAPKNKLLKRRKIHSNTFKHFKCKKM